MADKGGTGRTNRAKGRAGTLELDAASAMGTAPLELSAADMLRQPLPEHMPPEMFTGPGLIALADLLPIMTAYIDRDEIVRFLNRPLADYFEQTRSALLGLPVREVMGEETYAERKPLIDATLRVAGGHAYRTRLDRADGDSVGPGDRLATVHGPTRLLLTVERTVLNLLGHLGGVATETRRWVDAVAGTSCAVRDTRKTTPLMRGLEKYAVRCGGGVNHRRSLSDEALVKDNHVLAAGGVAPAYRAVRAAYPELPVQVEVDTYEQAVEAVDAGADLLLLDNMDTAALRRTVERVGGRARLEASGGLTLDRAAEVAATGVDYVAVGALTHSAPVLDIGLDLRTREA